MFMWQYLSLLRVYWSSVKSILIVHNVNFTVIWQPLLYSKHKTMQITFKIKVFLNVHNYIIPFLTSSNKTFIFIHFWVFLRANILLYRIFASSSIKILFTELQYSPGRLRYQLKDFWFKNSDIFRTFSKVVGRTNNPCLISISPTNHDFVCYNI